MSKFSTKIDDINDLATRHAHRLYVWDPIALYNELIKKIPKLKEFNVTHLKDKLKHEISLLKAEYQNNLNFCFSQYFPSFSFPACLISEVVCLEERISNL